jgi:hypothetical protein
MAANEKTGIATSLSITWRDLFGRNVWFRKSTNDQDSRPPTTAKFDERNDQSLQILCVAKWLRNVLEANGPVYAVSTENVARTASDDVVQPPTRRGGFALAVRGGPTMWEQYKRTLGGIQSMIWLVTAGVFMWSHAWIVALMFLVTMQIAAVIGAMWGYRLKGKVHRAGFTAR